MAEPCDFTTQYATFTPLGDRICNPLTVCNYATVTPTPNCVARIGVQLKKCNVLTQYVSKFPTETSNRECYTWAPCSSTQYIHQEIFADSKRFIVKPQVCRENNYCNGAQEYTLVDGTITGDRDSVCATITQCASDEYEVSTFTVFTDRVCAKTTQCHRTKEYILSRADATHDNICAERTFCQFSGRWRYQAAVDSPAYGNNGTDTVCRNFSSCPVGHYHNFSGSIDEDVQCHKCPVGTYGSNGMLCKDCPTDTYADEEGLSQCKTCTQCNAVNFAAGNVSIQLEYMCPPGQSCTPAYKQLCSVSSDSECMHCPPTWKRDKFTGLCEACANGYHQYAKGPGEIETHRCKPCPANFYCNSKDSYEICQDLAIFQRTGSPAYEVVPSSPEGSTYPIDCNCSAAGGFQGKPTGLLGCTPCASGTFSAPGDVSGCSLCPLGTYSSQETVIDLYKCPTGSSPEIKFAPSDPWPPSSTTACSMTIGPDECTACPPVTPHTRANGSTSVSDCSRCAPEHYYDTNANQCTKCAAPCHSSFYEFTPCTDNTNRQCAICDQTTCGTGEHITSCPVPNSPTPFRGCAPCTNKPGNSTYVFPTERVTSEDGCPWRCVEGFYSVPGVEEGCRKCKTFDGASCPPGRLFVKCSSTEQRDSSCARTCNENDKPRLNSRWVKVIRDAQGNLVRDDSDPTRPNEGCQWECLSGFRLITSVSGVKLCISNEIPS